MLKLISAFVLFFAFSPIGFCTEKNGAFEAEIDSVHAISDHFPTAPGQPKGPHNYLYAIVKLINGTNRSLPVEISEATLSPSKSGPGRRISMRFVPDYPVEQMGKPASGTPEKMTAPPGESIVCVRVDGIQFESNLLYLTLTLSTSQGKATARGSGSVGIAQ